jgi:hypothetical protein
VDRQKTTDFVEKKVEGISQYMCKLNLRLECVPLPLELQNSEEQLLVRSLHDHDANAHGGNDSCVNSTKIEEHCNTNGTCTNVTISNCGNLTSTTPSPNITSTTNPSNMNLTTTHVRRRKRDQNQTDPPGVDWRNGEPGAEDKHPIKGQ